MAVDPTSSSDVEVSDYSSIAKPPRGSALPPDARVAPTCMIWSMFIGLGFMVLVILVWAISSVSTLLHL